MSTAVERWTSLRDREALGDALNGAELAELAAIERNEAEVRGLVMVMNELEGYLQTRRAERPSAADRAIAERALSAVQVSSPSVRARAIDSDAELERAVDPDGPSWVRLLAVASCVLMVAAAAVALIFYEPASLRRATPQDATPSPREPALAPQVEALASARTAERGGRLRRAGRLLPAGTLLGQGDELSAGEKPGCFLIAPRIDVCVGSNSVVRITRLSLDALSLELRLGRATASLGPEARGARFEITAGDVRALALGTVFGLERTEDASLVRVRVLSGQARVSTPGGDVEIKGAELAIYRGAARSVEVTELPPPQAQREWELVAAGLPSSGAPAAPAPAPSAEAPTPQVEPAAAPVPQPAPAPAAGAAARELMQQAWELLKFQRWGEAAAVYEEIAGQHAGSEEAHIVLVRLGDIELDRLGRPERALAAFDRYLSEGGGPLEAEARFGRVKALRRLGRAADEREAIEAFVRAHPNSPKVGLLQTRLRFLPQGRSEQSLRDAGVGAVVQGP